MTSPKLAILNFCSQCIVDPRESASPAEQIAACPSRDCALYEHRPTAVELEAEERVRSLREAPKQAVKRNQDSVQGRKPNSDRRSRPKAA